MITKKIIFRATLQLSFAIGLFVILNSGCEKGIAPEPEIPKEEQAGFSGKITFSGEWQEGVQRTHLVVFENPLLSASDFNVFNLKFVGPEIPYGTTELNYNSVDSSYVEIGAGEFAYVAVAQSKAEELSLNRIDWYVVGVYYANNDTTQPGKLVIPEKTLVKGIDIICDYDNPPPQPPGGQ